MDWSLDRLTDPKLVKIKTERINRGEDAADKLRETPHIYEEVKPHTSPAYMRVKDISKCRGRWGHFT